MVLFLFCELGKLILSFKSKAVELHILVKQDGRRRFMRQQASVGVLPLVGAYNRPVFHKITSKWKGVSGIWRPYVNGCNHELCIRSVRCHSDLQNVNCNSNIRNWIYEERTGDNSCPVSPTYLLETGLAKHAQKIEVCLWNTLCPRWQQSPKSYFSFKVKVKVTKSVTLLSFERASLVEYACQIWSLYPLHFKSYSQC